MKQVNGYLANDGTFFKTAIEAAHHEHSEAIRQYCESQGFDFNMFMEVATAVAPHLIGLFTGPVENEHKNEEAFSSYEVEDELKRQGEFETSRSDSDEEPEIAEARRRKAELLGDGDSPAGTEDDAGTIDADTEFDFREPDGPSEDLLSPRESPANNGQGTRPPKAAFKFPIRRSVSLSDVGGRPLPTTVPDES